MLMEKKNQCPSAFQKYIILKPLKICVSVAWCIIAAVSFPISVFLLTILHIYRYAVGKTAKFIRSDLGKILSAPSSLAAAYGVHESPEEIIILTFIVDGNPSTQTIRSFITDKILSLKKSDEFIYPELRQYVTTYGGFYFWKWEKNFEFDKHLKVYNEDGTDDKDVEGNEYRNVEGLHNLRQKLLATTFEPKISPWQFIVIRDYEDEREGSEYHNHNIKTAIILRMHHCMADGYSLFKIVTTQFMGKNSKDIVIPSYRKANPIKIVFRILKFFSLKTFQIAYASRNIFDRNDWHRFSQENAGYHCAIIPPFPIQRIYDIKNMATVSYTTVLLAVITGVARKIMIRREARLPNTLRLGYPFPRPGHPDNKMRNHFTAAMIDLPVGMEDPLKRLANIEQSVLEIKKYLLVPIIITGYQTIIGGAFHWLMPVFTGNYLYTGGLTNFPGPREKISFCGSDILEVDVCISIPRGNIAFGVGAFSYLDKIFMSIQINKALVDEEDMELLENYVLEEIELLTQCVTKIEPPKHDSIEITYI